MSYGREITVEQTVVVEIDDTKFTPEWMEEFRASFFRFYDLDDHLRHLGQLYVRGLIDGRDDEFIEGYGVASEMGIRFAEIGGGLDVQHGSRARVDNY